jgi:phosphoribosylanthranilate isomerase
VAADAGASFPGVVLANGPGPGAASRARARLARQTMILAGGLTPQTVRGAAALVGPEVVDVSSGVEILPGIKDPTKIARFMEAVCGHSAIS